MQLSVWARTLAAACLVAAAPAAAVDGIAIEAGAGDNTDMARVAIQWNWSKRWHLGSEWHVGGYWDLGLGYWKHGGLPDQPGNITELGLTPVFRLQRNGLRGPYAEAAIGFHLLSRTSIGDKRFSTTFQFGDHVGLGYRFGVKGAWEVGYRFQHLSNADIKKPNDGIDFHLLRAQYHF